MPTLADLTIKVINQAAAQGRLNIWDVHNLGIKLMAIEGAWAAASAFLTSESNNIAEFFGIPGNKFVGIFNTHVLPSQWVRDDSFDDLFLRGAATYGGKSGATGHIHTRSYVPRHRHSVDFKVDVEDNHKHTYNTKTALIGTAAGATSSWGWKDAGAWPNMGVPSPYHIHSTGGDDWSYSGDESHPETNTPDTDLPTYIETVFANPVV